MISYRLPPSTALIVRAYCIAYPTVSKMVRAELATSLQQDIYAAITQAAAEVMRGEEKQIPEMIRAIAEKRGFSKAEDKCIYGEKCWKKRKADLMCAIAKHLSSAGLIPLQ